MPRQTIAAAATAFALAAVPAHARLGDEPTITEGLIAVGIAYEISEVCPTVDARKVRGLARLMGLRGRAAALGYSAAEIDAFVEDDAEKDRLEAIARARLAAMGAPRGDVEAHCVVGRREAARGGPIGSLLRAR